MTSLYPRSSREMFIPGAKWEDNESAQVCRSRHCSKRFSILVQRHHCRWCGGIFCDTCAPKKYLYRGACYRRCARCRLPVVFRSYICARGSKDVREARPAECILSFLTPKSITALMQSCSTMMHEFPIPKYPYMPCITARFPSFYEGAQIGQGGFGTVYKCEDREKPENGHVAIKRLSKSKALTYTYWCKVLTELQILEAVKHPNIARLIEVFQTVEDLVIVLEAGEGGTARRACDYIRQNRLPIEPFVGCVVQQIAAGLDYLYRQKRIVHRDIKLENIVLSSDFSKAMIIDFGLAEFIVNEKGQSYAPVGTPGYAAPENIEAAAHGATSFIADAETMHKGDLFSLGIVAYTLLTSHRPLRSKKFAKQYEELQHGISCSGPRWDGISSQAADLVSNLVQLSPNSRPDYSAICLHPFIQKYGPMVDSIINNRKAQKYQEDEEMRNEWEIVEPESSSAECDDEMEQFPVVCRAPQAWYRWNPSLLMKWGKAVY